MQRIHVLRGEGEVRGALLERHERDMTGVGFGMAVRCAAFVIPAPHQIRVARETGLRRKLFDAMRVPKAARAAKGRQPAFRRHAGARQHENGGRTCQPAGDLLTFIGHNRILTSV